MIRQRGATTLTMVLVTAFSVAVLCIGADFASTPSTSYGATPPSFCQGQSASAALSAGHAWIPKHVSQPTVPVLLLNRESVQAGDRVYARIANFSHVQVIYGSEFKIERYVQAKWTIDPASPRRHWLRTLRKLTAGKAGRCYEFTVPASHGPSMLRFSTRITNPRHTFRLKSSSFKVES